MSSSQKSLRVDPNQNSTVRAGRLGESLRTPVGMAEKHDLAHNWHTNTQNGQGQAPELPLQMPALHSLTAVPRQGLEPRTY